MVTYFKTNAKIEANCGYFMIKIIMLPLKNETGNNSITPRNNLIILQPVPVN